MATRTFDITKQTNGGADRQYSGTITIGSDEMLRIRFTEFFGDADASLEINANGVLSFVSVENDEAWATAAVIAGDVCRLSVNLNGDSRSVVKGIMETFS